LRARRCFSAVAVALLVSTSASAFDLQGHRGARGLLPENSLPAFARALTLGVSTLELDAGVTKDGRVVVAHDRGLNPDLARTPDGAWLAGHGPLLQALSFDELRTYDVGRLKPGTRYALGFPEQVAVDGTRVPELTEVFALAAKAGNTAVRFNIETKLSPMAPGDTLAPEPFARAVIAAIRGAGVESRATIQSFDWRTLLVVQREAPDIATAYLTLARGGGDNVQVGQAGASPWLGGFDIDDHGGSTPRVVTAAGGKIWSPFFGDLDAPRFQEAKALGLAVIPWTVNDPAAMGRLLDLGVDGIITDYPDRLRNLLAERGLPLPPATPVTP
jgi:glycerophosphoryl diester phosphodiesterase